MIRVLDVVGLASFGGALAARCECLVPEELRRKAEGSPLLIATHVRREGGELLLHDGPRSPPVEWETSELLLPLVLPQEPGRYLVEVDPVVETKFWGSSIGVPPAVFDAERTGEGDLVFTLPGRTEPLRLPASGAVFRIPHPRYGAGDSERAVEIPWVLSRYRGEHTVVDVGSANAEPRYLEALQALRIPLLIGLDLVKARALRGQAVAGDVRLPPIRPGSVDLALAISVIEHVGRDNTVYVQRDKGPQDPEGDFASVRALAELLRPGGRLLVTVPFGRAQDHGWLIQYDQARLDALVERSGLRLAELELFEYAGEWRGPVGAAALAGRGYRESAVAAAGVACLALERAGGEPGGARSSGRAVHQFCPAWSPGDPVAESAALTRRLLRGLGFHSEIYTDGRSGAGGVRSLARYDPSPDSVLLVHHVGGHDQLEWLLGLPDRKALVLHPAPVGGPSAGSRESGRSLLGMLKHAVPLAVASSPHCASELESFGYTVRLMPPVADLAQIRAHPWAPAPLPITGPAPLTLLFVDPAPGSVDDLVQVLSAAARRWEGAVRAVVASPSAAVLDGVRAKAGARGLAGLVHGLRPDARAELYGWYRAATALLRLDASERSPIPVIEAMALGLPVVALDTASNRAVLGRAGILVKEADREAFASLAILLAEDRALCRAVLETQQAHLASFAPDRIEAELGGLLSALGAGPPRGLPARAPEKAPRPRVQIEGPFETSYSLACVNRELALALEQRSPGSVALFATEGPGDFQPDRKSMERFPGLSRIWRRGSKASGAPLVVRNLYPPRVADMDGELNVLYFAWEESAVPAQWVDGFNRHLDGLCVLSRFVRKALLDSGVSVPISVGGCGIDQVTRAGREPYAGALGKKFRFLHVSSCFPRKGIDVLLRAYTGEFTAAEDVSLVIKTFANPHNRIREQLAEVRARPGCPDIVLIEEDLSPGQVVDLYQRCQAFVAPSRGEGFGLPLAEAMHFGLPVIATGFGGHLDFCDQDNAWLVDYTFARAQSHFGQFSSVWAEPDAGHLARAMRQVIDRPEEAARKARRARDLVDRQLTWASCAGRLEEMAAALRDVRPLRSNRLRIGWVSSWNTRCGIASYSKYLVDRLSPDAEIQVFAARTDSPTAPDEPNVTRCWDDASKGLSGLEAALRERALDVVVIQFSYAFFNLAELGQLLEQLRARGVTVVIAFHATRDVDEPGWRASLREILPQLSGVDRLLVHTVADLNRLRSFGLVENAALVPHGVLARPPREPGEARAALGLPRDAEIVATYGFLLPHKGLEELLTAFATVARERPRALLFLINALYPVTASQELGERLEKLVRRHGLERRVVRIHEYLQDGESLALLECADLMVFPYQRTGESSSAAVRFGLASNRPVACTPLEIFSDVAGAVHSFGGATPEAIAGGISALLRDPVALRATAASQQAWLAEHDWGRIAHRLRGLLRGLVRESRVPAVEAGLPRRGASHA